MMIVPCNEPFLTSTAENQEILNTFIVIKLKAVHRIARKRIGSFKCDIICQNVLSQSVKFCPMFAVLVIPIIPDFFPILEIPLRTLCIVSIRNIVLKLLIQIINIRVSLQ